MAIAGILILVVFIITAILLILVVLIQDDQGGGIGGMFGGGESSSPFGSRTGNVLTKFTSILGAVFLISAFALAWLNRSPDQDGFLERARLQSQLESEEGQWWIRPENPNEMSGIGPHAAVAGEEARRAVEQVGGEEPITIKVEEEKCQL